MQLSQQSSESIKNAILKAIGEYIHTSEQAIITDIHLQPDQTSGQLTIFDDEDRELANITIEEWSRYNEDDFSDQVEHTLRNILSQMKDAGDFDRANIMKPYSFVLVDEEKETIADLLLMDDDTLFIDNELLKGLDKELDDFLKELLEK